jgi:hypothetical protein
VSPFANLVPPGNPGWQNRHQPWVQFRLWHPHVQLWPQWKPKREPNKTKAELREMLAAAVGNTQPQSVNAQPEPVRDAQPEPKRKT